ncbi:uncharacterized protein HRG_09882 [Hirsutella rhossiliensis]|uniref:Uncharacterized protein n=1 Tax=Hirsutella rhossiliensis TaxID=111463 RepID=A0A9P8MPR9_9HYPO|nr:uncharacterized protein HRG_09882 [Hirsutella rhossiliensis]KAH0958837.1 hypothetical protein HRG_09882 [Hirsutella rhossiliensis]
MSSSSASSSEEDPIAYRNTRIFPPQFPAPPTCRSSAPRSRSLATNRITTWVSQYEKARSPRSSADDEASVVSDVSSYAEVQLLWQQLKEKRAKVGDIKQQMAKMRQELRILRRRQDEADNAFMSVIRPVLVNPWGLPPTSAQVLDSRMAAMQDLRDQHHFRETDYEALELMVDDEETKLNGLETRFFSLLAAGQSRVEHAASYRATPSEAESGPPSDVPYELRGISADKPSEDLHPLYVELTSAVGDLENAKEEYQDLLYVKEQYEFESKLKWSTGKKTTAEADDFFAEFPAEEARMKDEVSRLENQVESLKQLCEAKKVMRKHMSLRMAYALDPHTRFEELELEDKASILARKKSLAHAVFSEILSQPDHVLAEPEPLTSLQALRAAARLPQDNAENKERQRLAAKEYSIDNLTPGGEAGGRGDLVNRWLLQQLRQSPLNVQLLHSTFVASRSLRIRDLWRWQRDAMYYWWRDSTMGPAEDTPKCITSVDSNDASCPGTPQMSRAVSEGQLGCYDHHPARRESDSAVTATG